MTVGSEEVYRRFAAARDFTDILEYFQELCDVLEVDRSDFRRVYRNIKTKVQTYEAKPLWALLDKRAKQAVYEKNKVCSGAKMVVIGAGPCGLRMAIEGALLGARVIVVEMREYFARNNVLHLWPFVIHDLKTIGAKVFYPGFCTGSINHISIRRLQSILLKIALILGVEVHTPVAYEGLTEPEVCEDGTVRGWRLELSPEVPSLKELDIDIIVGADGKRNTLTGFHRKLFRGKQAIAITCNFVNLRSHADNQVKEIGGIFYVFRREFFDNLQEKSGIELENFVYYRGDTHYFVMTARKRSLLGKGVIREDSTETGHLLRRENIDPQKLRDFAIEAAIIATENGIPMMQFATNHHGEDDVAIFDFTQMTQATHSSLVVERENKRLLKCIVGDSLIEPFWPTGSGCARGFLSVFDAAWLMRSWCPGKRAPLEVLGEREALLKTLSQSTPGTLKPKLDQYTIDPTTRYNYVPPTLKSEAVKHLWDTSDIIDEPPPTPMRRFTEAEALIGRRRGRSNSIDGLMLSWYQQRLAPYKDVVTIFDMLTSWRDGRALCALMHAYRPESIDMEDVEKDDAITNLQRAFEIAENEWGISPLLSPEDLALSDHPDALSLLTYLHQLKDVLALEPTAAGITMGWDSDDDDEGLASDIPPTKRHQTQETIPDAVELSQSTTGISESIDLLKTTSPSDKNETVPEVVETESDVMKKEEEMVEKEIKLAERINAGVEMENENKVETKGATVVEDSATDDANAWSEMDYLARGAESPRTGYVRPVKPLVFYMVPVPEGMEVDDFTPDFHNYGMASLDVGQRHNRGRRPSAISLLTGMSEMIGTRKRAAAPESTAQAIEMMETPSDTDTMDACLGIAAKRILALQNQFNNTEKPKEAPPPVKFRTWSTEKKEMPEIRKELPEITTEVPDIRVEEVASGECNEDEFLKSSPEGRSRLKEISSLFDRGFANPYNERIANDTENGNDKENTNQGQNSHEDAKRPPWASIPGKGQTSQVCCICGEVTYILERQSKDGHFFHRHCCTCATCHCTLRIGSLYIHETRRKVTFLCFKHAQESGYFTPRRRKSLAAIVARKKMDLTDDSSVPAIHIDTHDDEPADKKIHLENGDGQTSEKHVRFNMDQGESKAVTLHERLHEKLHYLKSKDSASSHANRSNDASASPEVSVISHFKVEHPGVSHSGDRHVSFTTLTLDNENSHHSERQRQGYAPEEVSTRGTDMQNEWARPSVAACDNDNNHWPANGGAQTSNVHYGNTDDDQTHDQTTDTSLNLSSQELYKSPSTASSNAKSSDTATSYQIETAGDESYSALSNGNTPATSAHVRFAQAESSGEEADDVQPDSRVGDEIPSAKELVQTKEPTEMMENVTTYMGDMHMNGSDEHKITLQAEDDGFSTETDSPGMASPDMASPGMASPGMASSGSPTPESSEVESEADEDDNLKTPEEGVQEDEIPPSHYDRKDSDLTGDWAPIGVPRRAQSAGTGDQPVQDGAPVVLRRKSRSAESKRNRPSTVYRHSTSIRLLMAHEIQSGLEDVDQQEEALEERGRHVEEVLRGFREEEAPDHDELLEEWMEVLQQKQELRNKEIRLLLKKKLLDLQEQKKQLHRAMEDAEDQEGILEEMEQLDTDMADVRSELAELTAHIRESQTNLFIPNFGETKGETLV